MERVRPGPVRFPAVAAAMVLLLPAAPLLTAPALAAPRTQEVAAPDGWTIGALPPPVDAAPMGAGRVFTPGIGPIGSGAPDRAGELFGLHEKYRVGGSLLQPLQPYATLAPWVSATPGADGRPLTSGGVLLDVPVGGGFTFTPSVGAGYTASRRLSEGETVEFRSQLEIGYAFENRSRVTLGYTHMRGADDGRGDGEMVGFTLRLPFGALGGD